MGGTKQSQNKGQDYGQGMDKDREEQQGQQNINQKGGQSSVEDTTTDDIGMADEFDMEEEGTL